VSYEELPPNIGPGTTSTNGSDTIQYGLPPPDTLTTWIRRWLSIDVLFNGTEGAAIKQNATLKNPNGITEWTTGTGDIHVVPYHLGYSPEITRDCTININLQNIASVDAVVVVNWTTETYEYNKPLFYYGIAGLVLAAIYPLSFIIKHFSSTHSTPE
jgi:hypothetical protein